MKYLALAAILVVIFIVLDLVWFRFAGEFFKSQVGSIARLNADGDWNIRIVPALLVYVCMTIGLMVFVLPHVESFGQAFLLGGLFGLVGYGLYDLTNLATLSAWTVPFVITDMAWGTFLCAVVAASAHYISRLPLFASLT